MEHYCSEITSSRGKSQWAVFCGAGISWNSDLPLADELKRSILQTLPLNATQRDQIMSSVLPFEAVMETLSEIVDISKLLDIFDQGTPNLNHVLIARLAKDSYLKNIATTNFDLLLEKALENEGLINDVHFRVYYDEEQFSNLDFSDDGIIRIIKLHGTVDFRNSIRTTMKSVSSNRLSEKRMNPIRYMFSTGPHQKVLILGYSCSDVFDITPLIQSLNENLKEILFIDHSTEYTAINDIATKDEHNPFRRFKGKRILCNTDRFMENLWKSTIQDVGGALERAIPNVKWPEYVNEWAPQSKCIGHFLSGSICFATSHFFWAVDYYKQAQRMASALCDEATEAASSFGLGNAHHGLGHLQEAISYYTRALDIDRGRDSNFQMKCHVNLGIVYFKCGDSLRSDAHYRQALDIAKAKGDTFIEARCYSEIGIGCLNAGNFHQAIQYQQQALRIAKAVGDMPLVGACYGNLGIAYYSLEKFQQALAYHQQQFEIAKALGDRILEAGCLSNLGRVRQSLGEFRQAISDQQQALHIFKVFGDRAGQAVCYVHLGETSYKLKEFQQSVMYLLSAEDLLLWTKQSHLLKTLYGSLAEVYKTSGDLKSAIDALKKQEALLMEESHG